MINYYECHLTIESDDKDFVKAIVVKMGWSFSSIEDDIVIGPGTKMYATRHYNIKEDTDDVLAALMRASQYLENHNIKVIRRKIEKVIYDDRSSKVRIAHHDN